MSISLKKKYKIEFLTQGSVKIFPWKKKFYGLATKLLREENKENNVNIILCEDEFVRNLNKNYRGLDKVTDVLSFEMHDDDLLGEIYIAVSQVKRQAPEYGNSYFAELKRVIVHGLLHLSGYDHIKISDRKIMRQRECEFLGLDPYKEN